MGPPSFLAPKLAKVVRYSIIGRLGERLMRAFAETVVSLCDLPYCSKLDNRTKRWASSRRLTMGVNGDRFTPSETHQAHTIGNLGPNTL